MIYSEYGKTGKQVSAVGFGGMRFDMKQSDQDNADLVRYALDAGVNYFDTAPGYCDNRSEELFGMAIAAMPERRDEFCVSTKGMPTEFDTAEKAVAAVETSLGRLQCDKIDFYHVWCIRTLAQYELAMRPGGQYEGLRQCQERGLIEHIVVSTHLQGARAWQILQRGEFAGVLLGMSILNFPFRWEAVVKAHEMGLGVVAMNPLSGGLIPQHAEQLAFLAGPGETPTEAALRFLIGCPQVTVALNGFTTREHVDQACRVADNARPLSEADIARVRASLSENMDSVCTGCGYCLSHCPVELPIASYMQFYNAHHMFGVAAEQMVKDIKPQREYGILVDRKADAGDCTGCRACENVCTQHLDIVARLKQVAAWEAASAAAEQDQQ